MLLIGDHYYRFKTLAKLSVLEINVIAATLVLACIIKIVAPNDFGLQCARLSQLTGHIISVDNKNAVEHYLAQNLNDYINKEFVKQSTQV
jgi:L-cystine uptake protein TcyP (sodium:dicarboxylate symporter family)